MGVDTDIYFPPQTRLRDVADVMATLLGHPTKYVNHGKYESCDVEAVQTRGIVEMPECSYIHLTDRDGKRYFSPLYQFESSGPGDGHGGWHVILLASTPFVIALARRLVTFFGGAVCYQDCAGGIDYTAEPPHDMAPEDGEPWREFERAKSEVKPLTFAEIAACRDLAAYKDAEAETETPWLEVRP